VGGEFRERNRKFGLKKKKEEGGFYGGKKCYLVGDRSTP
jgi:hypothetical protein